MAPNIPWQVFAWLITGIMGIGTGIIGWAVWRGNQTAKLAMLVETMGSFAKAFERHVEKDEQIEQMTLGVLSAMQQNQAVIMDRLGISNR